MRLPPFRVGYAVVSPLLTLAFAGMLASGPALANTPDQAAQELLRQAGFRGGLIVHVGCGAGELIAALGARDGVTVQGLDADAGNVARAREHIQSLGRYGPVSVGLWDSRRLPYADNLVNLLVVEDAAAPQQVDAAREMLRVLAPGGAMLVRRGGEWRKTVKPRPDEIDEWTHYLHGPGNNAVADDTAVGPPRHVQWIGGPAFARSHEFNSSLAAMVASGGTIYYIWDEGPIGVGDPRFPSRWSLLSRDAFNGALLWRRPMPEWGWQQWHDASRWNTPRERYRMLRYLPPVLPRRLVAAGGKVYVTLAYDAPVTVLDGATGEVVRVLEATAPTDEIVHAGDGVLALSIREPESDVGDLMETPPAHSRIAVFDAGSGKELWRSEPESLAPVTLAVHDGRVVYSTYEDVVCRDLQSGRELWRNDSAPSLRSHRNTAGTLVVYGRVVLYTPEEKRDDYTKPGAGRLHAFCLETGELRWRTERPHYGPGITNQPDLFVADGLVWGGDTRGRPAVDRGTNVERQGHDPLTGQVVRRVAVEKLKSPGHHYRCYRSKATQRYLLLPKRGVEFLDLTGDDHMRHDWLRGPCIYGVVPANGMLYVPPHQCVCYPGVLLDNFNALIAQVDAEAGPPEPRPEERLQRGPVEVGARSSEVGGQRSEGAEWPMYRADARRRGSVATRVEVDGLKRRWEMELPQGTTPPVVAEGVLLVAEKDSHTVHAVDAQTGEPRWRYTAGGRIDSPPTVHRGRVLFGSADGWVYCLRLADGALAWRFMAAPRERRVAAFGQFESAWPVHGSVLVQEDPTAAPPREVAYAMAGRSSFLDGGLWLYGLDPETGELLHQAHLESERPDPRRHTGTDHAMDGAKTDLLVSDGSDLYFLQERFAADLTRMTDRSPMRGRGVRAYAAAPDRSATGKRLIATGGLLDDTYAEGTFWTYTDRWPGWDRVIGNVPGFGQLVVFDDRTVYGVNVFTERIAIRRGFTPGRGYRLFARHHDANKDAWSVRVPVRVRAMVLAGDTLFFAGPPDEVPPDDPLAALEGRRDAALWAVSPADGEKLLEMPLDAPPVFDGLIAAGGRLYASTADRRVVCFETPSH